MAGLQKGDAVYYRALDGMRYDAVVTNVRANGIVDIEVNIGAKEPWPVYAVIAERIELKEKP